MVSAGAWHPRREFLGTAVRYGSWTVFDRRLRGMQMRVLTEPWRAQAVMRLG